MKFDRNLFVKAPLAGIKRNAGLQSQQPFSSLDSMNFWPRDAVTGRWVIHHYSGVYQSPKDYLI